LFVGVIYNKFLVILRSCAKRGVSKDGPRAPQRPPSSFETRRTKTCDAPQDDGGLGQRSAGGSKNANDHEQKARVHPASPIVVVVT
jgi:hypothetical protein